MTFLEPYLAKIGIALASVAACVALWFYVQSLRSDVKVANDAATTAQHVADERGATIDMMRADQQANADAVKRLEDYRASLDKADRDRSTKYEEAKNDPQVNAWATAVVPDAVAGLYQRPAVTGSAAYLALRRGDAVQPSSGVSANE
ncbi:hypothetical protein CBA19CS91_39935 [Paraburkholderia hospita]|nr:hypothetical protein CBA19CS91_39935 [Paraburkholderia hospita]